MKVYKAGVERVRRMRGECVGQFGEGRVRVKCQEKRVMVEGEVWREGVCGWNVKVSRVVRDDGVGMWRGEGEK